MRTIHPSFPPELIDAIIDACAKDREKLKILSVASKSCLPRCRKYLFRSIEFSADHGEDTLAKRHESFQSIIARDPRVPTYVKKLVVVDLEMAFPPDLRWMITNTPFHETLCLLGPHLKRFTFIADNYAWNTFPASFKLAFMSIFSSPSLASIRIQGLEAIPKACCVSFGSQELDLTIVTSSFSDTVDPDLPMTEGRFIPPNLYSLHLEDVEEGSINVLLDAWIPAPLPGRGRPLFPSLVGLSIGPPDEDALGPIWELVQAGRKTIQFFSWYYSYGSQARPLNTLPLNLGVLEKPLSLRYEVTFYPDDEIDAMPYPPDHFDGLISLLRTVKPGTIRQLHVTVDFQDFDEAMESLQEYDGWGVLKRVLASESLDGMYRFILQLDLTTLFCEDDIGIDTDLMARKNEIRDVLEMRLPSLLTRNSEFIFTVERQTIG